MSWSTDRARRLRPEVVVTYAVHGVSGFRDHLVAHAAVKRAYCALRERGECSLRRLALFTLAPSALPDGAFPVTSSPEERIGAAVGVAAVDVERARAALACYATYAKVIAEADPLRRTGETVYFELFQERRSPPVGDLHEGL